VQYGFVQWHRQVLQQPQFSKQRSVQFSYTKPSAWNQWFQSGGRTAGTKALPLNELSQRGRKKIKSEILTDAVEKKATKEKIAIVKIIEE
jgi:hypothetical protein